MCDNVIYTMKKGLVLDTKTRKILPRSPLVYARMYRGRCDQREYEYEIFIASGTNIKYMETTYNKDWQTYYDRWQLVDRPRCWQLDNSWISNIQES